MVIPLRGEVEGQVHFPSAGMHLGPTWDSHPSRGRRGRSAALVWEVVGISREDQDQWPELAY